MKRFSRRVLAGLLLLVSAIILLLLILGWQINRLGGQELAQPSDAIVILGARVNADGSPGSDLLSRTYHGMDLYNAGLASVVICAGGSGGDRLAAGAVACRFAVEALGLPPERAWVVQDRDAYDTASEAQAVAELMRQHGLRSAILVSHPLHLFRARWLFQSEGLDVSTSPTNTDLRRITPLARLWYTLREAGGVILTALRAIPGFDRVYAWLNQRVYGI
jgi:uncharacterized SAM-binding protein YcdF (DUF218 family)